MLFFDLRFHSQTTDPIITDRVCVCSIRHPPQASCLADLFQAQHADLELIPLPHGLPEQALLRTVTRWQACLHDPFCFLCNLELGLCTSHTLDMMVRPCYYVLELGQTLKAVCFPAPLTDPGWENQNSPRLTTEPLDLRLQFSKPTLSLTSIQGRQGKRSPTVYHS